MSTVEPSPAPVGIVDAVGGAVQEIVDVVQDPPPWLQTVEKDMLYIGIVMFVVRWLYLTLAFLPANASRDRQIFTLISCYTIYGLIYIAKKGVNAWREYGCKFQFPPKEGIPQL